MSDTHCRGRNGLHQLGQPVAPSILFPVFNPEGEPGTSNPIIWRVRNGASIYMMSAKFCDPSPPVTYRIHATLFLSSAFF